MHIKTTLCFIILCAVTGASALSSADNSTNEEAIPVDSIYAFIKSAGSLLDEESFDSALIIARRAHELTESYTDLPDSTAAAVYNQLGLCHYQKGNADSAEPCWVKAMALREADKTPSDSLMAEIINNMGRLRFARRQFDEADSCVRQALAIRESLYGAEHPQVAQSITALAAIEAAKGNQDEAETLYLQAIHMMREARGENDLDLASTIRDLAVHYDRIGRYPEADSLHRQVLEIRTRILGPRNTRVAGSMNSIAIIAYKTGRYAEADSLHRQALEILRETVGEHHIAVMRTLTNLANIHLARSEYSDAESLYRQALDIAETIYGSGHREYMRVLVNLAAIYHGTAEYLKAESLFVIAREIARGLQGDDGPDVAFVEANLASILTELGRYALAGPMYEHSTDVLEKSHGSRHPWVASNLYNLAFLYKKQGRYYEAIDALKRTISISIETEGPEHPVVAQDFHMLAGIYTAMGRLKDAEELYQQALDIRVKAFGMENPSTAFSLGTLADIKGNRGEYEEAERMHRQAWEIRERVFGPENRFTAQSIISVARVLLATERYDEAEALYRQSVDILEKVLEPDHPDLANTFDGMAITLSAQGKYDEAIILHQKSLQLREKLFGPNHPNVAENLEDLSKAYASSGNYDSSLTCYQRLLALRQRFISYVFSFSSEEQKLRWIKRYPLMAPSLLSCALLCQNEGAINLTFEMALKAKALVLDAVLAEKKVAYCSEDARILEMLENRAEICSQIAALSISESEPPGLPDSLQFLFDIQDSLESELSRTCSPFREELLARRFQTHEIAAALPDEAVLWEFIRYKPYEFIATGNDKVRYGRERYAAFVLDNSGKVALADLGEAELIDSLIMAAREVINESSGRVYTPFAADYERQLATTTRRLHQLLFSPLAVLHQDKKDIFISPDGALNLLSFEILSDSSEKYVVETYQISYLSSGRDILRFTDRKEMKKHAIIIADPDFDSLARSPYMSATVDTVNNLSSSEISPFEPILGLRASIDCLRAEFLPLRHGQQERTAVADLLKALDDFSVEEYYQQQARESVLRQLKTPPGIIHIVTHGFFCSPLSESETETMSHPLLHSGLVLAGANRVIRGDESPDIEGEDGILTAYEVSGMDLVNTELATLSACETGVGTPLAGEGVFGLRRAFRHAGADAILMSLWKIPDKETALLMEGFYKRWLGGKSKRQALRLSSLEVLGKCRSEHGHGHPLLWGGFVLTGDPR